MKLSPRNARLLRLLVGKTVNHTLIDVFVEDMDRPLELLEPAHQMSFRGRRPESMGDWRRHVDRLASLFDEGDE